MRRVLFLLLIVWLPSLSVSCGEPGSTAPDGDLDGSESGEESAAPEGENREEEALQELDSGEKEEGIGEEEEPSDGDSERESSEEVDESAGEEEKPDSESEREEPEADPDWTDADGSEESEDDAETDGDSESDGDKESDGDAWVQPTVFDMGMIRDPETAQCSFTNERTVLKGATLVKVWDVAFVSWQVVNHGADSELRPITIRGYASKPSLAASSLPGIVHAHGLGGCADEDMATGMAALTGMFAIAYTGPGGGVDVEGCAASEGHSAADSMGRLLPNQLPADGYRMFDTLPDVRGSWFWGHFVAAMRSATCLETRSDVDGERIGITGFSAGGVTSMVAAGADDRFKAAVPLSGTVGWDTAVLAPKAWQHGLLEKAGLSDESPEWTRLMEQIITPHAVASHAVAKVMLVNGSSDEFFPLTAHLAAFGVFSAEKRNSIAANFDHGCYVVSGVEAASTIEERASLRASGAQRLWFRHWFETDSAYDYLPLTPQITQIDANGVIVLADTGNSRYSVQKVTLWMSNDRMLLFAGLDLEHGEGGLYYKVVPLPLVGDSVYYVDVEYKRSGTLLDERFSVSSLPLVPSGLVPQVRGMTDCLP